MGDPPPGWTMYYGDNSTHRLDHISWQHPVVQPDPHWPIRYGRLSTTAGRKVWYNVGSLCVAEGCPPGHLSVHPKLGLCHPKNLTQCAFPLVRMQLKRLRKCALAECCPPGHLSVHPKLRLCDPKSLTQCAFHLVRMQLTRLRKCDLAKHVDY